MAVRHPCSAILNVARFSTSASIIGRIFGLGAASFVLPYLMIDNVGCRPAGPPVLGILAPRGGLRTEVSAPNARPFQRGRGIIHQRCIITQLTGRTIPAGTALAEACAATRRGSHSGHGINIIVRRRTSATRRLFLKRAGRASRSKSRKPRRAQGRPPASTFRGGLSDRSASGQDRWRFQDRA